MRLSTNMPVNTEISFSQDFPPNNTATLRIKKHLRKKKFFRFGVSVFERVTEIRLTMHVKSEKSKAE